MLPKKTVICIPYAGGSSYMYNEMQKTLKGKNIVVKAIDLPGKGYRMEEKPCSDFREALADTVNVLLNVPDYASNCLFGYSMGTLLAYEAVKYIYLRYGMLPLHLFLAACEAPSVYITQDSVPWQKDDAFIEYLVKNGGITPDLAVDKDFADFFLPIIKNDYRILDGYKYNMTDCSLPMKANILYSDDERDISQWGQYFKNCEYYHFDGGHFFINQSLNRVCHIIHKTIINHGSSASIIG